MVRRQPSRRRPAPGGGRDARRGERRLLHAAGARQPERRLGHRARRRRPCAPTRRRRASAPVRPRPRGRPHHTAPAAPDHATGAPHRAAHPRRHDRRLPHTCETAGETSSPPTSSDARSTPSSTTARPGPSTPPASSSSTLAPPTSSSTGTRSPTRSSPRCARKPAATRTTPASRSSSETCRSKAPSSAPDGPHTTSASTTRAPSASTTPSSAISPSATRPCNSPPTRAHHRRLHRRTRLQLRGGTQPPRQLDRHARRGSPPAGSDRPLARTRPRRSSPVLWCCAGVVTLGTVAARIARRAAHVGGIERRSMDYDRAVPLDEARRIGRVFGVLYLITFVTSIAALCALPAGARRPGRATSRAPATTTASSSACCWSCS